MPIISEPNSGSITEINSESDLDNSDPIPNFIYI